MIHVLATVRVVAGRRDDFLAAFHSVVPLVRAEQGCLEYGPAVDLPTGISAQGTPRADVVVVVEKWSDLAALRAHLEAPHMRDYREKVRQLVVSTDLQVLAPA